MTDTKLRALVALAVGLDRELAEKSEQLKLLKAQLIAEANSRPEEQLATDGGGSSWTAPGSDGCAARVHFPAPSLKASVNGEKPAGAKLFEAVGRFKEQLFTPALAWEPVHNFRGRVRALFAGAEAVKIIRLCETSSSPRVSFETKPTDENSRKSAA